MLELRAEKLQAETEVARGAAAPAHQPYTHTQTNRVWWRAAKLNTCQHPGCRARRDGRLPRALGARACFQDRRCAPSSATPQRSPRHTTLRHPRCMEAKADFDRLERELREHKEHRCQDNQYIPVLSPHGARGTLTFEALMGRELYDIEILFKLKQGQASQWDQRNKHKEWGCRGHPQL